MSGGHFDYGQYTIEQIATQIEQEIKEARKPKPPKVLMEGVSVWKCADDAKRYVHPPSDTYERTCKYYRTLSFKKLSEEVDNSGLKIAKFQDHFGNTYEVRETNWVEYADGKEYPEYTIETLQEFETAAKLLRKAFIYAHRIDWLLSGDDGEDTFHERLKKDLEELK